MDRRNGGDPLAPPRPPKQLPRVHRPRAPEPETMMSETQQQQQQQQQTTTTTTTSTAATQCTNSNRQQQHLTQQQLQHFNSSSSNNNTNQSPHQQQKHSITATAAAAAAAGVATATAASTTTTTTTTTNLLGNPTHNNNNNLNHHSLQHNNISNPHNVNNNVSVVSGSSGTQSELEDCQILHLTFLPQRPSSLSRNSSHVSTTSTSTSSSSITAANTFTRRRPPPPTPGAAVPLLPISSSGSSLRSTSSSLGGGSSSNNNNISNSSSVNGNSSGAVISSGGGLANFLSHFHSTEPAPASSVTLAQPRPESERLTNEYVDTPLRTAAQQLQLQHASRAQHPAGQHDSGQTTTHHLLLLPQREQRQQQQQQHHLHQQHSNNRLAGTAGSATVTTGTDGTDGFLHSHNHNKSPTSATSATATTTAASTATNSICPHTGKVLPAPTNGRSGSGVGGSLGSFSNVSTQPITQPITKQPALTTTTNNTCKFAKDLPALDHLLDLHNISTGIQTPQGMVSAVNGASPLGASIIIGGDLSAQRPITCPHCGRCRCEHCQVPRQLPETWLCNKNCLCSAETVIDYASCLCCAKALFYHCPCDNDMDCDDSSGTPCVDNPCSCGPYKRTQRWGWLGALSLVLPCLWFYWPMRGCVALCEKCYDRYAGRRCRCQQIGSTSSMLPIEQLGLNGGGGNGIGLVGGIMSQNGSTGGGQISTKSASGGGHHHHHHHHNECSSAASRILRKGDVTPEKRLLDSSPEY